MNDYPHRTRHRGPRGRPLRRSLAAFAVLALFATPGCGYVLHPDRIDAQPSQDLDEGVVVMDALWLLPGLIPGVIALAVDFSAETAYRAQHEVAAGPGDALVVRAAAGMQTRVDVPAPVDGPRTAPAVNAAATDDRAPPP